MAKRAAAAPTIDGAGAAAVALVSALGDPSPYDVRDHYWIVAGDETRRWSSATRTYVAADDPAHLARLALVGFDTRIASEAELWDVLRDQAPDCLPADAPKPLPASITRRQMLLQLALSGMITGPEALAAAQTGAVPAAVQAVFDQLGPTDKLAAEITWATMSVADRGHPLVAALAATQAMTDAEIDDFFRAAGAL